MLINVRLLEMKKILIYILTLLLPTLMWGQDYPSVSPTALYVTVEGEEIEDASEAQSAPLVGHFFANPTNLGEYTARYEWKIWREGQKAAPIVHRFEENMDYTFTASGSYLVQLYATFVCGQDTIQFPDDPSLEDPFHVSITTSKLEFPNAFSPNGDGINDILRAKEGYKSIVSFEAAVFSRGGTKLYSWNDIKGGWDGKKGGKTVPDGVYFLVVNATGADGLKYNLRKTISVLTGYNKDGEVNP